MICNRISSSLSKERFSIEELSTVLNFLVKLEVSCVALSSISAAKLLDRVSEEFNARVRKERREIYGE